MYTSHGRGSRNRQPKYCPTSRATPLACPRVTHENCPPFTCDDSCPITQHFDNDRHFFADQLRLVTSNEIHHHQHHGGEGWGGFGYAVAQNRLQACARFSSVSVYGRGGLGYPNVENYLQACTRSSSPSAWARERSKPLPTFITISMDRHGC